MFLIIISCVALAIFLFSMDLSWTNVISSQRNDLVFEGRQTDYGAYALRKEHHRNLFYALFLAVGLIGGGFLTISLFGSKPVQQVIAPAFSIDDSVFFPPKPPKDPIKPKDNPPRTQRASAASAGATGNEVEVVERGKTEQGIVTEPGGGGEGPTGLEQPYDPGGEGDGTYPGANIEDDKKVEIFTRNMPQFPGGQEALIEYIKQRVRYTEFEIDRNVSGTIYVSFVVYSDGSVGDVVIERGIRNGERLAKRATEVLLGMPKWKPGDNGDKPLSVMMKMPLKFELKN